MPVTVQGNRLQLLAENGATVGIYASSMAPSSNIRIDDEVIVPAAGERFFNRYHVRNLSGVGDNYYVMIGRETVGPPFLRIGKNVGGIDTPMSEDFVLPDAVTHYRIRAQITEDPDDLVIRGAARDFTAGAIPEGEWDIEAFEDPEPSVPGPGIARIDMMNESGDGTDSVSLDNVVISVLDPLSIDVSAFVVDLTPVQIDAVVALLSGPFPASVADLSPAQLDAVTALFSEPFLASVVDANPMQIDVIVVALLKTGLFRPIGGVLPPAAIRIIDPVSLFGA